MAGKRTDYRQGQWFHKVVEDIERALAANSGAVTESPKRLPDQTTGRLREHDIVITLTHSHHQLVVALECRDRARPIGADQVEQFWAKCQHTGVNRGVIVSPNGFYKSAIAKANKLGIGCLTLDQVHSFPWFLPTGLRSRHTHIEHTHLVVDEDCPLWDGPFSIIDENGVEVGLSAVNSRASVFASTLPLGEEPASEHSLSYRVPIGDLYLQQQSTGRHFAVRHANCTVRITIAAEETPFELMNYVDKGSGKPICQIAMARVEQGGVRGSLVINYRPDEGAIVSFVPDQNQPD
jgi:hypothetical protein